MKTNDSYLSPAGAVFAAGGMRRALWPVVWAIADGRKAARGVDQWLMGASKRP